MDRNTNAFAFTPPEVDLKRSKFNLNHRNLTTFNTGDLIPFYCEPVLPGDTFTLDLSCLVRMSTSIFPTMDNAYLDTYFFFVPNRLTWNHWKEFCGENTSGPWVPEVEYQIPVLHDPNINNSVALKNYDFVGTTYDYFGLPITKYSEDYMEEDFTGQFMPEVSALPFRAYGLIYNEWFRDQNIISPIFVPKSDQNVAYSKYYALQGGAPLQVSRYHDYFSSALPSPQKGPAVDIPILAADSFLRVDTVDPTLIDNPIYQYPLQWFNTMGNNVSGKYSLGLDESGNTVVRTVSSAESPIELLPKNLGIKSSSFDTVSVNTLRQAFAVQRIYERDARGGSRYREILKAHFGVTSQDSRMQIPEYLGGKRIPINMEQVVQTSSTDATSPLGTTAGFSITRDVSSLFTKSFVEHGYIIGVCCVRTDRTYQQGIRKHWSYRRRFDMYWPALANIGEQAVLKKELLWSTAHGEEAFGYQEPWAEYRYSPNKVTGYFRSGIDGSLDSWHYADFYENDDIYLSEGWLNDNVSQVDRTLAVSSALSHQFLADFYFNVDVVRPMPLYSIPGLIDHN